MPNAQYKIDDLIDDYTLKLALTQLKQKQTSPEKTKYDFTEPPNFLKKDNMKDLLAKKQAYIKDLEQSLSQYNGAMTQDDIMRVINRVAVVQGIPKFFPKPRASTMTKTGFLSALSNYFLEVTTKPDVDTLAE